MFELWCGLDRDMLPPSPKSDGEAWSAAMQVPIGFAPSGATRENGMCWSFAASATMVTVGTAATAIAMRRRLPAIVPAIVGYFTLMEALQTAGYLVADTCGTPANRAVTLLSYLHIVFQPLVINAFGMHLLPGEVSRRLRVGVYGLCALSAAVMLLQLAPLEWAGSCRIGQPLCGSELCVRSGSWHIAWHIPFNGLMRPVDETFGLNLGFPSYMLTVFLLPVAYGAWRFAVFHFLIGPLLANLLTRNQNEAPAIWCLFSIAIILVTLSPPFLRWLHVDRWPLWPRHWQSRPAA